MDQLLKQAELFSDLTTSFTMAEALLVMGLSFFSALVIGWTYKHVHRGVSYSQSYVQTLVVMEVTIAVIMLVIGSNIARAFSLVGALSIIRFRTAVKDTKDLGFIFFTMAAGMSIGTRFYALGIVFTIAQCIFIFILHYTNFGAKHVVDKVLKVQMPKDIDKSVLDIQLEKLTKAYYLVSVDAASEAVSEFTYIIEPQNKVTTENIIETLQGINQKHKVLVVEGQQKIDL